MDEADRLLEASFEPDLHAILTKLPAKRQTLLFSATMTKNLVTLQKAVLHDAYLFQVCDVRDSLLWSTCMLLCRELCNVNYVAAVKDNSQLQFSDAERLWLVSCACYHN